MFYPLSRHPRLQTNLFYETERRYFGLLPHVTHLRNHHQPDHFECIQGKAEDIIRDGNFGALFEWGRLNQIVYGVLNAKQRPRSDTLGSPIEFADLFRHGPITAISPFVSNSVTTRLSLLASRASTSCYPYGSEPHCG